VKDADFFVSEKFKIYFCGFTTLTTVFPIKIRDRPTVLHRAPTMGENSAGKYFPDKWPSAKFRQNFGKISAKFRQNFGKISAIDSWGDPHYPPDVATASKTGYVQISINSQGLLL